MEKCRIKKASVRTRTGKNRFTSRFLKLIMVLSSQKSRKAYKEDGKEHFLSIFVEIHKYPCQQGGELLAEFIDPLLINFLFILLPIFIYHMFAFNKYVSQYRNQFLAILSTISIITCMEFGVEITEGYYYDLRFIPLVLCILYGGHRVGIVVVFLSLVYRYMIGGPGFFVSLVSFILILLLVSFARNKFEKSAMRARILIALFFSILFNVLVLINFTVHFGLMPISRYEWTGIVLIQLLGTAFITYIIETLRKTETLQNEAAESEKLKVVSSLAASIAHEIRNPLTVTKGFLQLLKENKRFGETEKEYVDFALKELDSADEIITEYLTFAKPEIEKIQKVDLSKELMHSIQLIKPLANMNNILIKAHIEASSEIMGDSAKLHQCFLNIMKNSIESIKECKGEGIIEVFVRRTKQHSEVVIYDNGAGMTKEQVRRLGTPYFSTKEQGTGLGMMVVFSLIRAMEGKINVTSEKWKGTKVEITFPSA